MTRGTSNSKKRDSVQPSKLLKPQEVAALLGVTRGHLANLRYEGRGLRYVKVGAAVRYYAEDVASYIAANTVEPWAVGA